MPRQSSIEIYVTLALYQQVHVHVSAAAAAISSSSRCGIKDLSVVDVAVIVYHAHAELRAVTEQPLIILLMCTLGSGKVH